MRRAESVVGRVRLFRGSNGKLKVRASVSRSAGTTAWRPLGCSSAHAVRYLRQLLPHQGTQKRISCNNSAAVSFLIVSSCLRVYLTADAATTYSSQSTTPIS